MTPLILSIASLHCVVFVRALCAVNGDTLRKEGAAGLYRGLDIEILKTFVSNFCLQYNLTALKNKALEMSRARVTVSPAAAVTAPAPALAAPAVDHLSVFANFGINYIASCLTQIVVNPLNVVTTRMQTAANGQPLSLFQTLMLVFREGGFAALYR